MKLNPSCPTSVTLWRSMLSLTMSYPVARVSDAPAVGAAFSVFLINRGKALEKSSVSLTSWIPSLNLLISDQGEDLRAAHDGEKGKMTVSWFNLIRQIHTDHPLFGNVSAKCFTKKWTKHSPVITNRREDKHKSDSATKQPVRCSRDKVQCESTWWHHVAFQDRPPIGDMCPMPGMIHKSKAKYGEIAFCWHIKWEESHLTLFTE